MPERLLKALCLCYLLTMFIGSFLWIAMLRSGIFDGLLVGPLPLDIAKEYQYYALSGTIGGSLYALRLFYWHNIRQKLNIHKWWIWYFLRPILSGGTAAIMILMVQVGNSLIALISLAFLMGYGFGKVMDKLDGLTETFVNGSTASHSSETQHVPHSNSKPQTHQSHGLNQPSESQRQELTETCEQATVSRPESRCEQATVSRPESGCEQATASRPESGCESNGSQNPDQPMEQIKS